MLKRSKSDGELFQSKNGYQGRFRTFEIVFQQVIIILLFVAALAYLGRMLFRAFHAKSCATGCGKCGAVDFDKIEKQINAKNLSAGR